MTSALLYLFQRCCGNCWGNIGNIWFQSFASSLELREETFYQVTNLLTFPRIFQQLELLTFKVVWNHDANALTGDFVQYGWLRLPTKSYALAFLSVCGVTHYVYIPFDLKSIEIVGPSTAIQKLIDMSNGAATSSLEEAQLESLRQAFGMGATWTTADEVCVFWERRSAFFFVIVSIGLLLTHVLQRKIISRVMCTAIITLAMVICWKTQKRLQLLTRFQFRRLRPLRTDDMEVAPMEVALTGTRDLNPMEASPAIAIDISDTAATEVVDANDVVYSLLLARNHYFEVVKQTKVFPESAPIVNFAAEARMYAVKMQPNFVHYVAERTAIPENALLHICVYNPLIDPYLTQIYQNFQKGVERENLLLIILPPLAGFDACLRTGTVPRTRTASSTQFVGTLGDYELLLLQMTAGFIRRLVFIFPIDENTYRDHVASPCDTWVSTARVLGESNCFWHR